MKKSIIPSIIGLSMLITPNVYACGEINNLTTSVGTVTQENSTNYIVTIPEGTQSVTLNATTDYSWVMGYGPREVVTNERAELKVDGSTCGYGIYTYFIKFNQLAPVIAENTTPPVDTTTGTDTTTGKDTTTTPNTDTTVTPALFLSSLTVKDFDLVFDKNTLNYDLTVKEDTTELEIEAAPEDTTNTVTISENAKKLLDGDNKVTVTLVNAEGVTTVYTINVTKPAKKSDNNFLASLTITGYTLNFDSSTTTYNLSIGSEKFLDIKAIAQSELAEEPEILNNSNLKDGSVVTIRVTAEDGSTRNYVINIKRQFNIMDYWMYIAIVCLVLLLIILIIINKSNKNKKKKAAPTEIDAQANTAGTIQNIEPAAAASEQAPVQAVTPMSGPVQLEPLAPTNVQPAAPTQAPVEQSAPTTDAAPEVFKL